MNAPRISLLFVLCAWAASCGGEGFTAAPGGQPDASTGGTDAAAEASAGQGGSAGTSPNGGSAGASAAGGTGGVAGTGGASGTGGVAGTAGTGGSGAMGGTGGVAGTGGVGGTGAMGGTGGVGGTAGAAGTGGIGPECPPGQQCLLDLPAGWTPIATGTLPPVGCAQPVHTLYSQTALDTANDFVCPCTCGAPSSGSCSAKLGYHTEASCTSSTSAPCAGSMSCTQCIANPSNATHYKFTTTASGNCATPASPPPTPTAISGYECSAFAESNPATCDNGGICVHSFAAPAKLCVLHAGTDSCPSGFTNANSYYESITDTRTCDGTCVCLLGCKCSGGNCHLKIHADATCGSAATLLSDGACTAKPGGFGANFSADLEVQPQPACQAASSTLKGQAAGADHVTICCTP